MGASWEIVAARTGAGFCRVLSRVWFGCSKLRSMVACHARFGRAARQGVLCAALGAWSVSVDTVMAFTVWVTQGWLSVRDCRAGSRGAKA
jgi:hypothetical protein